MGGAARLTVPLRKGESSGVRKQPRIPYYSCRQEGGRLLDLGHAKYKPQPAFDIKKRVILWFLTRRLDG